MCRLICVFAVCIYTQNRFSYCDMAQLGVHNVYAVLRIVPVEVHVNVLVIDYVLYCSCKCCLCNFCKMSLFV